MAPSLPTGDLTLRGVEVRAGATTILSGMNLTLRPGELVGLIGPSGAGKSTMIKVLLGIREPTEGKVEAGGQPLSALGPVGYVPQDDALHLSLTVAESLDFSAQLRLPDLEEEARAARIREVCAAVGLAERMDLKIGRLSGGQRKRVSVALELLTEPPVLILDEPTSGLDPGMEAQLMALFQEVARTGRVVMVATHAMQSLERCDALVVLVGGRLAFCGPPQSALSWFETDRYTGVFEELKKHAPLVWGRRWQQQGAQLAARPAPTLRPAPLTASPSAPSPAPTTPNPRAAAEAELAALKAKLRGGGA